MEKNFIEYDELNNLRQLKPSFVARNGAAIYICKAENILKNGSLYGDKTLGYLMNRFESIDIDDEFDWYVAESILRS